MSMSRNNTKRPSVSIPVSSSSSQDNYVVGLPNQELFTQNLRTRRSKCIITFSLEDFSRIHGQFSEKNRASHIETPVYSFYENEKIKFQLRLHPSKHCLNVDAVYKGSEQSAQLIMELYLLDASGRRFNFEFGRKVEYYLSAVNSESNGNFVYDRDDLEKKRDKLFIADKLTLALEVNATWIDVSEYISNINE